MLHVRTFTPKAVMCFECLCFHAKGRYVLRVCVLSRQRPLRVACVYFHAKGRCVFRVCTFMPKAVVCCVCVLSRQRPLGRLLSVTCATILARGVHTKARKDTDESALVLTRKNCKTVLHPVSTGSRTHGSCFRWIVLGLPVRPGRACGRRLNCEPFTGRQWSPPRPVHQF